MYRKIITGYEVTIKGYEQTRKYVILTKHNKAQTIYKFLGIHYV